ncbi:MAG: Fe-S cluster assembly protein SufB, partial [Chloroflexota bacterium]|nr:Fe-S cluster assembly protein SufB [Chloroflexota bacterium]
MADTNKNTYDIGASSSVYKEKYGFFDPEKYVFKAKKGLNREIVEEISWMKNEPDWMLQYRLRALEIFHKKPMPQWGGNLNDIDFDDIYYFLRATDKSERSWDDVPADIKKTFDRLGIPEAERKFLSGVGAQYESEVVYHNIKESLSKQGVIFLGMDQALAEHPDIVKKYFGTMIPSADNKFAALNSAVWSGGSFIYVPPGVHVEMPLQAYFRINAQSMGQFERTLIIADEGSYVHYVEGCFLAGARVRTREGEKGIEEIHKGDKVLTHRGRYRQVYHTMQRPYQGNLYHIRYYGDSGKQLHVTAEHPILAVRRERANERNRQFTPEWLTAADLKPGDYLTLPVHHSEHPASDVFNTTVPLGRGRHAPVERAVSLSLEPDMFRLLGYYFSEGHVDNEHYLSFSFNAAETPYL